ncbi:MAG: metal-dependent transcriptional regulator [Actinomycetaceae bacterium]|nr:metal-dependent transcriptional regulator [Actinomycetaceae bacterium]
MKNKRELSTMTEDYLRAIYSVEEWDDEGVGVTDLANIMGVVPSTASENVRKLRDAGLIDHEPYGKVRLTDDGRREAVHMVRRHRILETFLQKFLGFSWDEVHQEAEELEHAVSDRFIDKVDEALGYPVLDPHGDPIPSKDGTIAPSSKMTVLSAELDTELDVLRIRDGEPEILRYFESRGLMPGKKIRVLSRGSATGLITLLIDGERVDLPESLGKTIRVHPVSG